MTVLEQISFYGVILGIVYISVICLVGLTALYHRRDKLYTSKHAEFLEHKKRVEERLRKDRPDD